MDLLFGIVIGWISLYVALIIMKSLKEKKGIKVKDYSKQPFTNLLRDTLRHIVYEYSIKRKNNDFLLNINLDKETVMQIMHRAHFPELCRKESDIDFGMALYIPVKDWPKDRFAKLEKLIKEETEEMKSVHFGKLEYHIIDLGKRVRFGGYLLARIVKEVFEVDESQFTSSLYSEGNLPYWRN